MKKAVAVLMALILTVGANTPVFGEDLSVSAAACAVIEAKTGRLIFGRNENERRPMASTTKIMTTLLALESGNIDEPFTVDSEAIKVEGSSMGLTEGDTVTLRALCGGMLLPSGNDAANSTAVKLGGNPVRFAAMMNERAREICMQNTNFVTPSGLDAEGHYSTAYDMAILAAEAMKNADFREICGSETLKLSYGNPPYDRWLKNTNKLLKMYDGCIGVKTGFTDEAGRCLVSAAERNGVMLICVTLKAPDDWNDHKKMLDYGFSQVGTANAELPKISHIDIVGGTEKTLKIAYSGDISIPSVNGDDTAIVTKLFMPKFLYAPVCEGDEVGKVCCFYNDKEILCVPLVAAESIEYKECVPEKGMWEKLSEMIGIAGR